MIGKLLLRLVIKFTFQVACIVQLLITFFQILYGQTVTFNQERFMRTLECSWME